MLLLRNMVSFTRLGHGRRLCETKSSNNLEVGSGGGRFGRLNLGAFRHALIQHRGRLSFLVVPATPGLLSKAGPFPV